MPNTPNLALPYPLAGDPANVPSDILALATRLDNLASSGVFSKAPTRQILTAASGTYTTPAGCRAILVECIGGGGGGGGCASVASASGAAASGGGGAYAALLIANPVASYPYVVGAGGNGGAAGVNPGTVGGSTSFNATTVVAVGGGFGPGNTPTTAFPRWGGGNVAGGAAASCTGEIRLDGGQAMPAGLHTLTMVTNSPGGRGAGPYGGDGGLWNANNNIAGNPGKLYGGGGCGALQFNGGAAVAGGAGAAGVIIVTEYY